MQSGISDGLFCCIVIMEVVASAARILSKYSHYSLSTESLSQSVSNR